MSRLVCRIAESSGGRGARGLAAAARLRAPGRPTYEREMSAQVTSAAAAVTGAGVGVASTGSPGSPVGPAGASLSSLHQVVLARSMSIRE